MAVAMPVIPNGTPLRYCFVPAPEFHDLKNGNRDYAAIRRDLASEGFHMSWKDVSVCQHNNLYDGEAPGFKVPWLRSGGNLFKFEYVFHVGSFDAAMNGFDQGEVIMGLMNRVPKGKAHGVTVLLASTSRKFVEMSTGLVRQPDGSQDTVTGFTEVGSQAGLATVVWQGRSGTIKEAIEQADLDDRFTYAFFNSRFGEGQRPINSHNMRRDVTCLN